MKWFDAQRLKFLFQSCGLIDYRFIIIFVCLKSSLFYQHTLVPNKCHKHLWYTVFEQTIHSS